MGLYNFQLRFRPYILDGTKTHTIRADRVKRERVGQVMSLYTGCRTKYSNLLFRAPCKKVERIWIFESGKVCIGYLDVELSLGERNDLAWRDGFRNGLEETAFERMQEFWVDRVPFEGHIIHWDFAKRFDHRGDSVRDEPPG